MQCSIQPGDAGDAAYGAHELRKAVRAVSKLQPDEEDLLGQIVAVG